MDIFGLAETLVGQTRDVTWWQMTIRGVIVFFYGLLLVRFPGQRIFGKASAFDIVLAVLVGSNLSRALTGNSPFFATLGATTVIVLVHWLLAHLANHWHGVGWLAKGSVVQLVKDGQVDWKRMNRHGLSRGDLDEAMRISGIASLDKVSGAFLERNGKVSVVKR